jgi:anti-sigma factor RsiW
MRNRKHPTPTLLTRFARGEATSDETRAITRHLLSGCPRCSAVLWPLWKMAERLSLRRAPQPQAARRRRSLCR